jgi:hypothetical protein
MPECFLETNTLAYRPHLQRYKESEVLWIWPQNGGLHSLVEQFYNASTLWAHSRLGPYAIKLFSFLIYEFL